MFTEIKPCFQKEIQLITEQISAQKEQGDLLLAVVTDSHLDNFEQETLMHIRAVDSRVSFDALLHLGDFMNGSFSRKRTAKILREEMESFRASVQSGVFYPIQGNHDGFFDPNSKPNTNDLAVDEDWYRATDFTEEYPNVTRTAPNPYYYVDDDQRKLRIVVLCSFSTKEMPTGFQRIYAPSDAQLTWLKEEALALPEEWTVIFASHDAPLQYFSEEKLSEERWSGKNRQIWDIVLGARAEKKFSVAAWLVGHWHGDLCETVCGIPFVLVGCQTCYVPQLWNMPEHYGHFEPRIEGTLSQDLWDSILWKKEERTLYIYRFGAGEDRIVHY